jgi:hypothetical protein
MMKSLLALILAFGTSTGIATSARAEPQTLTRGTAPHAAQLAAPRVQDVAVKAHNANLDPNAVTPSIGICDQEDGFTGPTWMPLPGRSSVFGEGDDD